MAQQIIDQDLSVRETERLVKLGTKGGKAIKKAEHPKAGKDANTRALEDTLESQIGLKVEIKSGRGEKGTLAIHYESYDQLDTLLQRFR